ncbi:MAG: tetratricopeptide repeat protein [Bacteroidota bacterium]
MMGFALLTLVAACSPTPPPLADASTTEVVPTDQPDFEAGKVIDSIPCGQVDGHTYALYLPQHYTRNKTWPVVYVFDAHGRGRLPLAAYRSLADRYGYVLIGSNVSRNGLPWSATLQHIYQLMAAGQKNVRLDREQTYAMGFSGGARVAVAAALATKQFQGVIGCGAGFPSGQQPEVATFHYFGLVGNRDFNYPELRQFEQVLAQKGFVHHLQVFDGEHAWPETRDMHAAMQWLELHAYKTHRREYIEDTVQAWWSRHRQAIDLAHNRPVEQYQHLQHGIRAFDQLLDLEPEKSALATLEKSVALAKARQAEQVLISTELNVNQSYAAKLQAMDPAWWNQEMNRLDDGIRAASTAAMRHSYQRNRAYVSLVAYMFAEKALKTNRLEDLPAYLDLYQRADPENPYHAYFRARLLMRQQRNDEALQALQEAAELGFEDWVVLESEPDFNALRSTPGFQTLKG